MGMYLLVGFAFFFVVVGIILLAIIIRMYNILIHLQMTCENTAKDICLNRLQKGDKITHPDLMLLISHCQKASTLEKQVKAINKLRAGILAVEPTSTELKKLHDEEDRLQTEKRFFNNIARELADRLASFPMKYIGSMMDIHAPALLDLDEEAKAGLIPEAKYL